MSYCLSASTHTHFLRDRQRHFPIHPYKPHSTHASSTLCKRAEQAPACPRDDKFYKNESLFSPGTPADWQLRATRLLEGLLQARRSGTNLSWAVWMWGQSAAEGPGALRAFTRDLCTSGSLVVTPTEHGISLQTCQLNPFPDKKKICNLCDSKKNCDAWLVLSPSENLFKRTERERNSSSLVCSPPYGL